ncbi:MAG: hypothetical protein IJ242_02095 [Clostridia bacterium]|nr:hypothetical protein [Clostridia bacterium]
MRDLIKGQFSIWALLAAGSLFVLALVTQPLYADVDSYLVATVVNGTFGTGNGCQYTHVLLNGVLSFLSKCLPQADVFSFLSRIFIPLSFYCVFITVSQKTKDTVTAGAVFTLFLFLSVCISVFSGNYGIQAICYTGTGILLLLSDQDHPILSAMGIIYLAMGCMWRLWVSLLFLPFIALEVLADLWERPRHFYGSIRKAAIPFTAVAVLFLVQFAAQMQEPLKSSLEFDKQRIRLVDYGAKSWPEVQEEAEAAGISHAEYAMARQWLLLDTERFTTEKLKTIADIGASTDYPLTPSGLFAACRVLSTWFVGESGFNYVWFAGIILVVFLMMLLAPSWIRRLQAALILLGGQLIIFIFLVIGRSPMRLIHSVYLVQSFALIIESVWMQKNRDVFRKGLILICILFGASSVFGIGKSGIHVPQLAFNARVGADTSEIRMPEEDAVIIWDYFGLDFEHRLMDQGKLPTLDILSHNIPAGDWIYGQPYFDAFLSEHNLSNPYEGLFSRGDLYYAVRDGEALELFAELTPGFQAEMMGNVAGIPVYRFLLKE